MTSLKEPPAPHHRAQEEKPLSPLALISSKSDCPGLKAMLGYGAVDGSVGWGWRDLSVVGIFICQSAGRRRKLSFHTCIWGRDLMTGSLRTDTPGKGRDSAHILQAAPPKHQKCPLSEGFLTHYKKCHLPPEKKECN